MIARGRETGIFAFNPRNLIFQRRYTGSVLIGQQGLALLQFTADQAIELGISLRHSFAAFGAERIERLRELSINRLRRLTAHPINHLLVKN